LFFAFMARRRPTAFEVSFPEEAKREEALSKKREEDEKERKRLEAILTAQQVNQKKLRQKEREKEKQAGRNLKRAIEFDEDDGAKEVEVVFARVSMRFSIVWDDLQTLTFRVCGTCSQRRRFSWNYVCFQTQGNPIVFKPLIHSNGILYVETGRNSRNSRYLPRRRGRTIR
jgi:hypothetical protein